MKIATWNINGVKARIEPALTYLRQFSLGKHLASRIADRKNHTCPAPAYW